MTQEEAALLARRLGDFVREHLPGHLFFIDALSDLEEVIIQMNPEEPDTPRSVIIGNTETLEIKPVDLREWRTYGVEWMDDLKDKDSLRVEERKEVDRGGER